jgi:hypothetical protein
MIDMVRIHVAWSVFQSCPSEAPNNLSLELISAHNWAYQLP